MLKSYTWNLTVRTYETNRYGMVQGGAYLNYLEETATRASVDAGYPLSWYFENNVMWLIRKWVVRYLEPAFYGDELELTTWVSEAKRVQSKRDYRIRRASDGVLLVKARSNWAFVDTRTLRPQRLPEDFDQNFMPDTAPLENIQVRLHHPRPEPEARPFVMERTAQSYEIDMIEHINNGVYPRWTAEAVQSALRQLGWTPEEQMRRFQAVLMLTGREIDYFKPALEGDPIRITSCVVERSPARLAWLQEVRHAESGDLFVSEYSVYSMVDMRSFQAQPLPAELVRSVIR